jgi:hypothetical protein
MQFCLTPSYEWWGGVLGHIVKMQPLQPQPPKQGKDYSGHILVVLLSLLLALAGVIVGALQIQRVPPPWWPWGPTNRIVEVSPTPTPTPQSSPVVTPSPVIQQFSICGSWQSETSGKRYNFVCRNINFFEIYEVGTDLGLTKVGSGTITGEVIKASYFSTTKRRNAKLELKPSADGMKLEGTMQGDDPREAGWLTFHRISS